VPVTRAPAAGVGVPGQSRSQGAGDKTVNPRALWPSAGGNGDALHAAPGSYGAKTRHGRGADACRPAMTRTRRRHRRCGFAISDGWREAIRAGVTGGACPRIRFHLASCGISLPTSSAARWHLPLRRRDVPTASDHAAAAGPLLGRRRRRHMHCWRSCLARAEQASRFSFCLLAMPVTQVRVGVDVHAETLL
jgi:hypothetical protein